MPGGQGDQGDQGGEGQGQGQDGQDDQDLGDDTPILELDEEELRQLLEDQDEDLSKLFGRGAGTGQRRDELRPAPVPADFWAASKARAQVMARQLRYIPPKPRTRAVESGPRYSFRDEERHDDKSFRVKDVPTRRRTAAFGILVDCSGSMSPMMEDVQAAVHDLYLATHEVNVPMAVWAFSSWSPPTRKVVGYDTSPAVASECIKGLSSSGGTILTPALVEAGAALMKQHADRRVLIVIHDGQPSDMSRSMAEVMKLRRQLEVVGVFIGQEAEQEELIAGMRQLFRDRLVKSPDPEGLKVVLGTFLRRLLAPRM
jgi:Mg-chelatase subunit ChlD